MSDVLVLNGSYQPIRVIPWERAITLWYRKKAEILDSYPTRRLHSQKLTMKMPAIIRLTAFFKGVERLMRTAPPFSKKNVHFRDRGQCQYCGREVKIDHMTLDHVIPKAQGGQRVWENVVSSCSPCNTQKANRTPQQAGMSLRKKPSRPSAHVLFFQTGYRSMPHPGWQTYFGSRASA